MIQASSSKVQGHSQDLKDVYKKLDYCYFVQNSVKIKVLYLKGSNSLKLYQEY